MGTVTAIGEYQPERPFNSWNFPATSTFNGITSWITSPSVTFDDWQTAVDFAARLAPQVGKVRVRKNGGGWSVSWSATQSVPSTPVYPQPWSPSYPYVTYTSGASA